MDERCKTELKSSYIKLEGEVSTVANLLKSILEKQKAVLDKTDQSVNIAEIVTATEHNYCLFAKLFSFNIDLQTIWENCIEQACHKTCPTLQSSSSSLDYDCNIPNLTIPNEVEVVKPRHVLNPTVAEFCASTELLNAVHVISCNTNIPSTLNTKNSSGASTSLNTVTREEKTQRSNSQSKFALYEPKNRFERNYNNLKRAIPDLTFVPPEKEIQEIAKDDSAEYYSVSDLKSECSKAEYATKKLTTKIDNLEISTMTTLKVGDLGIVSYIHDVSEFYITPVETNSATVLSEQLSQYVQSMKFQYINKNEAKDELGKYCVAYSELFETWNRAEIIKWNMTNPNDVYVQFIDFGEYATMSYNNLRPIIPLYCQIERQALRCSLANVAPFNGKWSPEALRYFHTLCYDDGEFVVIEIDSIKDTSNGIAIDFHKVASDGITCIENMVISEYARYEDVGIKNTLGISARNEMIEQINMSKGLSGITEQDDLKSSLDKFFDVLPESYETIGEAVLGYNAQDDLRVCKHTRPDLTCYKGDRCKLEHKIRRKDGVTTDTERVLVAPENTFMLQLNEVYKVMITAFKSPWEIYGQISHSENGYGAVPKEIFKCMNKQEMITSYICFDYQPAIGELVIAKNCDERWYRAVILESNFGQAYTKCSSVKLFYVDTGEERLELLANVRKMTKGFIIHPYQAMHLHIANIKSILGHDIDAFQKFSNEYVFRNYDFRVKHVGASYVNGTFKDMTTGKDLGTEMIQNSFAVATALDYDLLNSNILVD